MISAMFAGYGASVSVPPESSVLVSGGGETSMNGTYSPRGDVNGKTYYNLIGQPDDTVTSSIYWDGVQWSITSDHGNVGYFDDEDVPHPWDGTNWQILLASPAPTVTESP